MNYYRLLGISFLVLLVFNGNIKAENLQITNLTVEYIPTPLGIDVDKPRFSWQMNSLDNERGRSQTAFQLMVSDEKGDMVWDSGKTESDISLNIEYAGKALKATTRYNWRVNVWDQNGGLNTASSWFETGLMNPNPDLSAWNGAQWIGSGDEGLVLYSSYLPVFKINYTLRLDQKSRSEKAGFIYGANDKRLMDKNKNIYQLQSEKDASYILVELDISNLKKNKEGAALLNVYRVGYHPDDKKEVPFATVSIPESLLNETNKYESHTFHILSVFGATEIFMDKIAPENRLAEVNLNPVGNSGDYIAFPMVADIGFDLQPRQKAAFSTVEVRNYRKPSNCLFREYTNETLQVEGGKEGKRFTFDPGKNSMPMLRTAFHSSSEVSKARLYVTARGIYEFYINGERIGNDYFSPGLTQYNKTHMYQTYDVTSSVRPGRNAMGALLGEGWWSGGSTYSGQSWNLFGDRQSLLAKLVITYTDGKEEVIVTRPDTWSCYNDGPIIYGSFFQGEVYDARKEEAIKGWSTAGYNDASWEKARVADLPHISRDNPNNDWDVISPDAYKQMILIGEFGENPVKIKELTAQSVEEVRPGVFVYDMGQNMVGVPRITLSGNKPGQQITLRYAEVKYPDLPEYSKNTGMIMLENIRAALAQDTYITRGGDEMIQPRFTFHGYRFLEITGIDRAIPVADVKGEVISSIHQLASAYETSNPKVNKLWENITWSTYANFLSIPTDCPQRNERLGWSGDISVFSRTATYLANVPQFLRKHMLAMRDIQRRDGRFTDVAPLGGGFGGILWGSAGITVAWESYQQYNDKRMLAEHYDAMKSYMDYLKPFIHPETGILTEGNLGDWLGPEQGKNDNTLLWEAYYIYDLKLMQQIATILEKNKDAEAFGELLKQRKVFFNKTYVDAQTKRTIHSGYKQYGNSNPKAGDLIDTQVSYVLPFVFNLYEDQHKEKARENFITTITRENIADIGTVCPPYSLMTGFIGTAWINKALSDNGRSDIAYKVLQRTTYPSWLYSVEQGATTIWERLNSYTHTDGFGGNNSMNSFNHYSFGAIGAWMYNHSLGIERDENSPGFKHFLLKPEPDPTGEMTYAKGYYDSMYGRIESSWETKEGKCYYHFTVPANTSATLYLQASTIEHIKENEQPVSLSENIEYQNNENGKIVLKLKSGRYYFVVE